MKKLIFPCDYVGITQGYNNSHKAIDMGWKESNHVIYAACDGVVTYIKNEFTSNTNYKTYGNYVKIKHDDSLTTLYAHLKYNSICVKVGDKIKCGDKIGIMGNTGYSFGVHLHYEVILNNEKVNPLNYTYYDLRHTLASTTLKKYKPMKLESEVIVEENNNEVSKENIPILVDDTIFEYICTKSGMYKIQLNENEKLIIKDI